MTLDFYKILGVSRTANRATIKRAYHRLVREFHPDLHPNNVEAQERIREVNAAYEALTDKATRARYDDFSASQRPRTAPKSKPPTPKSRERPKEPAGDLGGCWIVGRTGEVHERWGIVTKVQRQGVGLYNVFYEARPIGERMTLSIWVDGAAIGRLEYSAHDMLRIGMSTHAADRADSDFAIYLGR
jgi:curved DNA-binding protein CbpA